MGGSSGGGGSGAGGRDPTIAACRPQRPVLEMCLSTSVTALGMIMAGTGDLESLRVMRELRSRVEFEVRCAVVGVSTPMPKCLRGRGWRVRKGVRIVGV